ncbi:MAG: hypothetical protein LBN42_02280, partial [Oscillospiraceae bacterium]|nr:hypothetical protein [Oscillospiraceae bacterium]
VGKNTRYFEKVAAHVEPNSHNTVFWIFLLCAAVFSIVGYVLFQLNFDEYDISATGALFVILSLASFALPFSHTELKRAFNHINGGARFDNGTPQIKTAVIGRTGIITEQPFLDSIYAAVDRYGDKAKTEKFSPMSGIFDDTPTKRASANTPVNKRADSDFTAPFKPPDLAAIAAFRLGHIDDTDEDNDEQTAPLPPNSPETLDVLTLCALSADNSMFGQAVSAAARMVGVRPELAESLYEIPFTPERRVTTVVVRLASHLYVISAGKYEKISEICTSAPPMSADDEYERFTAARCAVTAVAIKEINFLPDNPEPEILERHLIFKGFVAFSSPVRDDAYAHIKKLSEHGVKTILVTGADAETAVNCAKISGIIPDKVTHGTDIDNDTDNDTETDYAAYLLTADDMRELSDDEIKRRVSLSVFAELDSAAKERIMSLEASTTSVLFCGRNLKHNVFGKERGAVAVAPCFASEAVKFIADEVLSDDPLSDIPPLIIEGDAKTRRITLITRLAILKMIPLIAALIILLTPGTDITALIAVGSMQLLIDTALVIAARTRMK